MSVFKIVESKDRRDVEKELSELAGEAAATGSDFEVVDFQVVMSPGGLSYFALVRTSY